MKDPVFRPERELPEPRRRRPRTVYAEVVAESLATGEPRSTEVPTADADRVVKRLRWAAHRAGARLTVRTAPMDDSIKITFKATRREQ